MEKQEVRTLSWTSHVAVRWLVREEPRAGPVAHGLADLPAGDFGLCPASTIAMPPAPQGPQRGRGAAERPSAQPRGTLSRSPSVLETGVHLPLRHDITYFAAPTMRRRCILRSLGACARNIPNEQVEWLGMEKYPLPREKCTETTNKIRCSCCLHP